MSYQSNLPPSPPPSPVVPSASNRKKEREFSASCKIAPLILYNPWFCSLSRSLIIIYNTTPRTKYLF